MKSPLVPMILGATLVLVPIVVAYSQRGIDEAEVREAELRDIAALGSALDSTRMALVTASTAADSARLTEDISSREYFLSRRAHHVANQAPPRPFWRPMGPAAITVTVGALLLAVGIVLLRRQRVEHDVA